MWFTSDRRSIHVFIYQSWCWWIWWGQQQFYYPRAQRTIDDVTYLSWCWWGWWGQGQLSRPQAWRLRSGTPACSADSGGWRCWPLEVHSGSGCWYWGAVRCWWCWCLLCFVVDHSGCWNYYLCLKVKSSHYLKFSTFVLHYKDFLSITLTWYLFRHNWTMVLGTSIFVLSNFRIIKPSKIPDL